MGAKSNIQWCDSTVNPTTGCDGCELWKVVGERSIGGPCYAGNLHESRLARSLPDQYAASFAEVRMVPGRMAKAAGFADLTGTARPDKPWLDGMPRMIFVGDMGDVLSKAVTFEFLKADLIDVATSKKGRRHVWMVLTKRPVRLVQFAEWLREEHGIAWPENIWCGTSVTDAKTERRAELLAYHPATMKFLSVEPMRGPVDFAVNLLRNFPLVIVGGESRQRRFIPTPFDIRWAYALIGHCREAGVSPFVKQVGATAYDSKRRISLDGPDSHAVELDITDGHGGDWLDWPADLRIREFPIVEAP